MQFGLQQCLVRQLGLVFGYQCRGQAAVEGVFHDLVILAGTQQYANGGVLVGFADIAIQRLQVKTQLAKIFRLEAADLEFDGHQAVEAAMEKQQVQGKVPSTHLQRVFGADKAKVAAQLDQKIPEAGEQTLVQIGLDMAVRQVEKLNHIGIA